MVYTHSVVTIGERKALLCKLGVEDYEMWHQVLLEMNISNPSRSC